MAPGHRLRHLQMGKAGHGPIRPRLGLAQQRTDQRQQARFCGIQLIAHPEFEIGCHLIVARPPRVQTPCRLADHLFQAGFDVHVDVFQRGGELEGAVLDL